MVSHVGSDNSLKPQAFGFPPPWGYPSFEKPLSVGHRGAAQAAGCEDCASPPAAGNYDDEPKDC